MSKSKPTSDLKQESQPKPPSQYHRTSITMPISVAGELESRRGAETFSGQIVNDLNSYWEAVRSGMQTLRQKFNRKEAAYISDALDARRWGSQKLDDMVLAEIVETIKNDGQPKKFEVKMLPIVDKLEQITMIELLALLNWSRTARQRGDSPVKAAAIFPERTTCQPPA